MNIEPCKSLKLDGSVLHSIIKSGLEAEIDIIPNRAMKTPFQLTCFILSRPIPAICSETRVQVKVFNRQKWPLRSHKSCMNTQARAGYFRDASLNIEAVLSCVSGYVDRGSHIDVLGSATPQGFQKRLPGIRTVWTEVMANKALFSFFIATL